MPLPLCACIKGLSQADKLDAIYCALLAIAEGGGITVDIDNVTGMTAAGRGLVTTLATPVQDAVILISAANVAATIIGDTDNVSPVTGVTTDRGVVTALT